MLPITVEKRVLNLVVFAGPATSLAISPWFNFDPINHVKILVLTCTSFAAFGLLVPYLPKACEKVGKQNIFILGLFLVALSSTFFLSGANKSQQFWGVFGRNTGILSYVSLILILFVTASLALRKAYARIVWSLVVTVAMMSAYCLIQIAKLDPIAWSALFPFGTLGNVNFLSGFMGLGLVTVFILAMSNQFQMGLRLSLATLFVIGIFVLIRSDSTQGVVALAAGIATYLLIKSWYLHRIIFILTLLIFASGFVSVVLGLFDRGPLKGLIYQVTVLFRADYMHAGISMLLNNPLTGVGIDSYDDWYRAERGIISALRTSLNRTANSAHNVTIDLAAGGGFPLLIAYLALLLVISYSILSGLKKGQAKDPFFMAIAMSWLAYQVQASVSINQIGVGVWGWILGGAILGYSKISEPKEVHEVQRNRVKRAKAEARTRRGSPNTPPPLPVITSALLLSLGFTFSFLPLKTDSDFAYASKIGSAQSLLEITGRISMSSFLLQKTTVDTFESNLPDISKTINDRLISRFPLSIGGWFSMIESNSYSQIERQNAIKVVSDRDPYAALCYLPDPAAEFRKRLDKLPGHEQYKLSRGWGLVAQLTSDQAELYSLGQAPDDKLLEKLRSFCGR